MEVVDLNRLTEDVLCMIEITCISIKILKKE
jgi:hypothetical protein